MFICLSCKHTHTFSGESHDICHGAAYTWPYVSHSSDWTSELEVRNQSGYLSSMLMDHSLQNILPFPSLMEENSFPIRLGRSEKLMGSERQEVLEAAAEMGVRNKNRNFSP